MPISLKECPQAQSKGQQTTQCAQPFTEGTGTNSPMPSELQLTLLHVQNWNQTLLHLQNCNYLPYAFTTETSAPTPLFLQKLDSEPFIIMTSTISC